MQKRISLLAEAVMIGAVAMMAINIGSAGSTGAKQEGKVVTVRMEGKKFVPEQITIKAGDSVEWVNEVNGRKHQVTTDPQQAMDANNVSVPKGAKAFDSGTIKAGESYRFQFSVAGTYHYTCPPHEMSGMVGTVVVEP